MERNVRDPRIAALPDIHGHAKGEHKPFAEERPIPYTARMLFLWFFHACRRFSPRFIMVSDHMNYLTFEDPAAVNLVRRALKLAQAGDLYGAAETAGVELGHAAVVSEGLRRGMRYSIGAEVDNDPRCRPDAQNIVDAMKPDGMVRSVHFIPIAHPQHGENWLWAFDNSEFKSLYEVVGTEAVWEIYMATLLDAIDKLPGNIIGHFYVPAKFGHWPDDLVLEGYEDRFIDACAQRGMAIEVNSRYFYKYFVDDDAQLEKYRSVHVRLLRKAKAKGVMIAVGSDAHSPKDQGAAFDAVLAVLDEAEVNEIAFPINGHLARVALRATEEILRQHNAALAPAVAERTPLPRSAAAHADAGEKEHGPADDRRDIAAVAVPAIVPVSSDDAAAAQFAVLGGVEAPGSAAPVVAGRPRRARPKSKPKVSEPTAIASAGSVASAEPASEASDAVAAPHDAAVQPAQKKRSHKKIVVPAAAGAPPLESPVAAAAASSASASAETTARESSTSPKPGAKKPVVTTPVAPEPVAARPVPARPLDAKAASAKPTAVKPATGKPVAAKPPTGKPAAVKPTAGKPAAAKPAAAKPAAAKPAAAKPAAAKPAATRSPAAKAAGAKPVATKATAKTAAKRPAANLTRTKARPAARGAAKFKPAKTTAKKATSKTASKKPVAKKAGARPAVQGAKAALRKAASGKASVRAAKQTISAKSTAKSSGTKKSMAKKAVAKKRNSRR